MTLTVITAPAEQLVDLELLKQQLEVDFSDRDQLLAVHLGTAVGRLESATQRRFLTQDLEWSLPGWPACFRLPVAPVAADGVSAIAYIDVDGIEQVLAQDQYVVSPSGHTVEIRPAFSAAWPQLDPDAAQPVRVQFTAGQAAAGVADSVKAAAMMLTGLLFEDREGSKDIPRAASGLPKPVDDLIDDERWT